MTSTYVGLAQTTLSSATSTVTFSSIPATYRDLIIVINATSTSGLAETGLRFNGDTSSIYSRILMFGNGSSTGSFGGTISYINLIDAVTTAGNSSIAQIMDYAQTDKHKTVLLRRNFPTDNVSASAHRWANTAAITTLNIFTVSSSLAAGTTIALYGVN